MPIESGKNPEKKTHKEVALLAKSIYPHIHTFYTYIYIYIDTYIYTHKYIAPGYWDIIYIYIYIYIFPDAKARVLLPYSTSLGPEASTLRVQVCRR